jgi:hypothetical protein
VIRLSSLFGAERSAWLFADATAVEGAASGYLLEVFSPRIVFTGCA